MAKKGLQKFVFPHLPPHIYGFNAIKQHLVQTGKFDLLIGWASQGD